ncbi:unnamed protein product [Boreogadus saida]
MNFNKHNSSRAKVNAVPGLRPLLFSCPVQQAGGDAAHGSAGRESLPSMEHEWEMKPPRAEGDVLRQQCFLFWHI